MPRHPPCTLLSLISCEFFKISFLPFYGKTFFLFTHHCFALFNFQSAISSFLIRKDLVGLSGLEPPTSRLSGVRSNRLSYKPSSFLKLSAVFPLSHYGGDEEDRTPDPLLARQVLSQLSYTPIWVSLFLRVF